MQEWRLINSIETNGPMQMAIDESILTHRIENLVPNTLRFYTWNPPAVTLGFFQNPDQEVNIEKIKEQGIDITRRLTGGGTVLHDHELTYSIFISEKDAPEDIIQSYEYICNGIINALNNMGIIAKFVPINDIITNGKKISGNAQTRKNGIILQHGTILLDVDVKKMFSVLKVADEKIKDKMIKSVEERVTSLQKELKKSISVRELEEELLKGFSGVFGKNFIRESLTPNELKLAEKLYNEKYSTKEWCYLR